MGKCSQGGLFAARVLLENPRFHPGDVARTRRPLLPFDHGRPMTPADFRQLVAGQRRGLAASLLRSALRVGEFPYAWATAVRNRRFDLGRTAVHRVAPPVVSVGNLTVGGTGKTPVVEYVARLLRGHGFRPAILSRGYGAEEGGKNDEALELELALPDVPHLQDPDRVAAAHIAIDELESDVLLLDDGFQHRRLARDLDIVLLDATAPFGHEHLLPRGLLRESPRGLRRAHIAALSRADLLDADERGRIERRVRQWCPAATWCELVHRPTGLLSADGKIEDAAQLDGARVAAFCGIGNPLGFRATLASLKAEIAAWQEFPDHHAFAREDVAKLTRWAVNSQAEWIVCTRKDLVKLQVDSFGGVPLRAVAVEATFINGQCKFDQAVLEACRRARSEGGSPEEGSSAE